MIFEVLFYLLVKEVLFLKWWQVSNSTPASALVTRLNYCGNCNNLGSSNGCFAQDNLRQKLWRKPTNAKPKFLVNFVKHMVAQLRLVEMHSSILNRRWRCEVVENSNGTWILDFRASNHMTQEAASLIKAHENSSNNTTVIGNGLGLSVTRTETATLLSKNGNLKLN